ncbi:MAG: GWxTD domain-containing protein [Bacteroidia bacterium]|nr:GWxTD domain-containing protein [Bacteroidia bacterium]
MAFLYNPGATSIHPDCFIYHNSDSTSLLFFRINTMELYFNNQAKEMFNKARIQVHYRLLNASDNNLIDSSTVSYVIQKNQKQDKFITYIPLHTNRPIKYAIEVLFLDYFRHKGNQSIMLFDKNNYSSAQNYFLSSAKNKEPFYKNIFTEDDEIKIRYDRKKIGKIHVKHYYKEFPLPTPPFSSKKTEPLQLKPDTIWSLEYSDTALLKLPLQGIYYIQTDTTKNEGMTLFNFGKHYPQMKTAEELIKPIKFLTTKKKFEELKAYENPKLAVDEFWLNSTGNVPRSKELIRIFYNRIQLANHYFTSYIEGWKTDRGMIYTIFGPPATIYKSLNMEKWIYGEMTNMPSMNFTFEKTDNPFTENDYILYRNEIYKTSWFQAIDVWRNGRAYSVEN